MAHRASQVILAYIAVSALSVMLTYALATALGHVNPIVPYLGYVGDRPIESTVFTQMFVIDAAVLAFLVHLQNVNASYRLKKNEAPAILVKANTASICAGYLSAFGLYVFACFQESHAFYVHHLGEFLYLMGSIAYFGLHTSVAHFTESKDVKTRVKIGLTAAMIGFFLLFTICYAISVVSFNKSWDERHQWQENDGGWFFHVLSAISEWILLVLFHVFLLTFYSDFKNVVITNTRIIVLPQERGES